MPRNKGFTHGLKGLGYHRSSEGEILLCHNEPSKKLPELGYDGRLVHKSTIVSLRPRQPFNYVVYRKASADTNGDMWVFKYRFIDADGIGAETQEQTSRFLFRVHSPSSAGINTHGLFRSEAMKTGDVMKMGKLSKEDIHQNLLGHMVSKKRNFSSPVGFFHHFTNIVNGQSPGNEGKGPQRSKGRHH